ncbi:hypothetical protein D3C76_656630 [compost metagenome]
MLAVAQLGYFMKVLDEPAPDVDALVAIGIDLISAADQEVRIVVRQDIRKHGPHVHVVSITLLEGHVAAVEAKNTVLDFCRLRAER